MTVETLISKGKERLLHSDMEPTAETLMAIQPPYEIRLITTIPATDSSYNQAMMGMAVTEDNLEDAHRKYRTHPELGSTIAVWCPLPDADEDLTAGQIADKVVFENYGPVGDAVVYRQAVTNTLGKDLDMEMVVDTALDMEHLTGDGILAMMREVARLARHGYVRNPF